MQTIDYLLRNEKKGSIDLFKAFLIAIAFHLLFIALFHVASDSGDEYVLPLPFSSVEVDLGEKPHYLLPSSNEVVLMFPEENPMSSLFSWEHLDYEKKWIKKPPTSLSNPDFSSLEMLPYTTYLSDL